MANLINLSYSDILKGVQEELAHKPEEEARGKLCEQIAMLNFELAKLKQKQKVYAAALRRQGSVTRGGASPAASDLPQFAEVDMRDALDALDGFYALEYGNDGPYRWTGPGSTVRFRVWVDRSVPMQLDAVMYSFGDERNRSDITLKVDGVEVPVRFGDKVIRSEAFPVNDETGATEIMFNIPHIFRPADRGQEDQRLLGVAFAGLKISPAGK
ncbi:hypothetical protein QMO56_20100 [Roseomonas sp. E05]|uniref:hypothetical protein n=1 Tax=Roseomonas sp. E05 TaxID=3046310 RepID=UPI0024BB7A93|nr:hypothetical protein [Roseomonas sp. E05]MDJ0390421.1 hypothetical protein [Roseomonas sp. E05]